MHFFTMSFQPLHAFEEVTLNRCRKTQRNTWFSETGISTLFEVIVKLVICIGWVLNYRFSTINKIRLTSRVSLPEGCNCCNQYKEEICYSLNITVIKVRAREGGFDVSFKENTNTAFHSHNYFIIQGRNLWWYNFSNYSPQYSHYSRFETQPRMLTIGSLHQNI